MGHARKGCVLPPISRKPGIPTAPEEPSLFTETHLETGIVPELVGTFPASRRPIRTQPGLQEGQPLATYSSNLGPDCPAGLTGASPDTRRSTLLLKQGTYGEYPARPRRSIGVSSRAKSVVFEYYLGHWDFPFWHLAALAAGFVAILLSPPADHGEDADLAHGCQPARPFLLGLLREAGNTLVGFVEEANAVPSRRVAS